MRVNQFLFLFIVSIAAYTVDAQNSKLWKGLDKGPYNIGFKTINLVDNSRQVVLDSVNTSRPLQISMWYPSKRGKEKMTMDTYFVNFALYRDFRKTPNKELTDWARKQTVEAIFSKTTNDSIAIGKLFKIPTEAYSNSEPINKKFPLVFLLSHVSTDFFLLAELLTSNGYVVISKYADGLITNVWKGWNSLPNSVNNDLIDLSVISTALTKANNIDFNNVGLIGYHGNINPLILFQINNQNVKAVVSIDGGEVWNFNKMLKKVTKSHPSWDSLKVNRPYLRIHSDLDLKNSMDIKHADWWFYKETKNPVTILNVHNLNHYDFFSILNTSHIVPGITGTAHSDPNKAHAIICNYTLHFLNTHVKSSTKDKLWLDKAYSNRFDNQLFEVTNRKESNFNNEQSIEFSVQNFEKDLGELDRVDIKSFDKATKLFNKYRKKAKNIQQVDSLFLPFFSIYNNDPSFLKNAANDSIEKYGFIKIKRNGKERVVPTNSHYLEKNVIRHLSRTMQKFCNQELKEFTHNNTIQEVAENTIWWEFFNRDYPYFFLREMSQYHYKKWHLKNLLTGTRTIKIFDKQGKLLDTALRAYEDVLSKHSSSETGKVLGSYLELLKKNKMLKTKEIEHFLNHYE